MVINCSVNVGRIGCSLCQLWALSNPGRRRCFLCPRARAHTADVTPTWHAGSTADGYREVAGGGGGGGLARVRDRSTRGLRRRRNGRRGRVRLYSSTESDDSEDDMPWDTTPLLQAENEQVERAQRRAQEEAAERQLNRAVQERLGAGHSEVRPLSRRRPLPRLSPARAPVRPCVTMEC